MNHTPLSITLNGQPAETSARTVAELVAETFQNTAGVAVAVDATVVPRSRWDTELHAGAHVEILTAVQGG